MKLRYQISPDPLREPFVKADKAECFETIEAAAAVAAWRMAQSSQSDPVLLIVDRITRRAVGAPQLVAACMALAGKQVYDEAATIPMWDAPDGQHMGVPANG